MDEFDLITAVQPDEGWIAVVSIKNGVSWQKLVRSRVSAQNYIDRWHQEGRDVYFGVARFGDPAEAPVDPKTGKRVERGQANVTGLKAFWIDLDCGKGKPYADQSEALRALKDFCVAVGLPMPTIVNSGRGLHIYWILTQAVTPEVWVPVAANLKALCAANDLKVDPVVFETARILRVPGTSNFKDNPPKPVTVMLDRPPVDFNTFRECIGQCPTGYIPPKPVAAPLPPSGLGMSALGQQIADDRDCRFETIIRGRKCAQLVDSVRNNATLEEPRWRAALSVAHRAIDRELAIVAVSKDHPDYDYDATDAKAARTKGPYTCAQFDNINPGGCTGCAYANTITSPIQLGKDGPDEDEEEEVGAEVDGSDFSPNWKTLPFPYFRHEDGGIWKQTKGEDGEEGKPILVYEHDFVVKDRMQNAEGNAVLTLWVRHPHDGSKTFTIPASCTSDMRSLKEELCNRSIFSSPKGWNEIMSYVAASSGKIVNKRRAKQMRSQFGWADGSSKFIVGNREITADGVFYSPATGDLQTMADAMVPAGTLEKWKEVANLYGTPGLEPQAFAMSTAFGAPLLRFSGQRGAMINLIHRKSGTGKTTALQMANSVWGHPELLNCAKEDSPVTKIHKMGLRGTIHITFDEMSNVAPQALSDMIYQATQGAGKDRMMASANQLRVNTTKWCTTVLCSSNHSFYSKLESIKASPEGEIMRVMEIHIEPNNILDVEVAKELFDHQLIQNYGHAGDIYARYLVENLEDVKELFEQNQRFIDKALKLTAPERFWSALVASNLTGAQIAIGLGLVDWDLSAILRWALNFIQKLRTTTLPPPEEHKQVLGDFIMANMANVLVVNGKIDRRSGLASAPMVEPKGALKARYEPDTKALAIVVGEFKRYCEDRVLDCRELLDKLKKDGVYLGAKTQHISKGMVVGTANLSPYVYRFDLTNADFDMPDLAEAPEDEEPDDEGGGD